MFVKQGYRVELDLNNAQMTLARKHCGAARFAYNYGLRRKQEAYKAGLKTPSAIDLHREINALKQTAIPWAYDVSKCAMQESLRDLDNAFAHFFRKCKLKKEGKWKGKCGYPKFKSKKINALKRASRQHSRKQKGSKNRKKAQRRLTRIHTRIANVRKDALHKATSALVAKTKPASQRPRVIVLEDLNIQGMLKNRKLSRAIADIGMYEFKRQILYKAAFAGIPVKLASRWEPSSKTCHACGWVKENLTLADRVFVCEDCGNVTDRDYNAAKNLAVLAYCLNYRELHGN